MPVDLFTEVASQLAPSDKPGRLLLDAADATSTQGHSYLRLDQDQVYEDDDKVMLDILVAKETAISADA